ncbi:type II secretion system protein [Haloferula sargassicola]|uniref:Type II secretion system protein n=1 Tax=Haloferula sargassicola TaxID=490096 RepID=A0ABP9UMZ6_9BACT
MTLLELTVVILVLMSLISILMIGARAWIRGTDRATCILNLSTIQKGVRSYQNMYCYSPGTLPMAQNGTQSIAKHLLDKGYVTDDLYDMMMGTRPCPGGGTYSIAQEDVFPLEGTLYVACSLEESRRHGIPPEQRLDW